MNFSLGFVLLDRRCGIVNGDEALDAVSIARRGQFPLIHVER